MSLPQLPEPEVVDDGAESAGWLWWGIGASAHESEAVEISTTTGEPVPRPSDAP